MFNTNKHTKPSTTIRGELYGQLLELGKWRMRLHDRYVHVATSELFNGHPKKNEVLELLQDGCEMLEIKTKAIRDMIEGIH